MTASIVAAATYLPPWGTEQARTAGPDEDAVTLAVAAGLGALEAAGAAAAVERVVFVTRDLPLVEGGSTAVLLAGLDLPADTAALQVVGGAPAAVSAVLEAAPGTLVVAADTSRGAGGAAVLTGTGGVALRLAGRRDHSLPTYLRDTQGASVEYEDPRLQRVRGVSQGLAELALDARPAIVAGLPAKDAAGLAVPGAPTLPVTGASAGLFALARLLGQSTGGVVLAVEQATVVAVELAAGSAAVSAREPAPREAPARRSGGEATIAISLAAYERAFDAKLRMRGGRCDSCGTLMMPPRVRCTECGSEAAHPLVPLPRTGTVYTATTVHAPVPGMMTPYSIVLVQLGDTDVRFITHMTDVEPGDVAIGDTGRLVFRRLATRSGVPDYGYSFIPDSAQSKEAAA